MLKILATELYFSLLMIAFIVFGAIVHATVQLKVSRDTGVVFTMVDFWILTVIAAFAGTVFGLLATVLFENQIFILVCAGVGAFLGMAGLNKLSVTMLDFLVSRVDKK